MKVNNVKKTYKPMLHGVGWLGDVKRVNLRIEKLKVLGFKPTMKSREAIRITMKELMRELINV
jgi:UDP-glucose 4-epimerase